MPTVAVRADVLQAAARLVLDVGERVDQSVQHVLDERTVLPDLPGVETYRRWRTWLTSGTPCRDEGCGACSVRRTALAAHGGDFGGRAA